MNISATPQDPKVTNTPLDIPFYLTNFIIMAPPSKKGSNNKSAKKASSPSKGKGLPFNLKKVSSPGRPTNNSSDNKVIIQLALVVDFAMVIHFKYRHASTRTPFCEHLFYTAIKNGEPWVEPLDIEAQPRTFKHVDNVIQKHHNGTTYHIPMFVSNMAPDIEDKAGIREFAQYIADNVNAKFDKTRGTAGFVTVPEDFEELVWTQDAVLSELIGTQAASGKMRRWLGADWNKPFEENKKYFRAFFRPHHIPKDLQEFLNAPDDEIHQGN